MTYTKQTVLQPLAPAPRRDSLRTRATLALVGMSAALMAGAASAQTNPVTELTAPAKSSMEALAPALIGILVVGIGIAVLFMVNGKVKTGVNKS